MIISLGLGLIAALCWGVHDICVRYVSQRTGIMAAISTVLIFGALLLTPVCIYFGNWADLTCPRSATPFFQAASSPSPR